MQRKIIVLFIIITIVAMALVPVILIDKLEEVGF
jgi:hypothetical protein